MVFFKFHVMGNDKCLEIFLSSLVEMKTYLCVIDDVIDNGD